MDSRVRQFWFHKTRVWLFELLILPQYFECNCPIPAFSYWSRALNYPSQEIAANQSHQELMVGFSMDHGHHQYLLLILWTSLTSSADSIFSVTRCFFVIESPYHNTYRPKLSIQKRFFLIWLRGYTKWCKITVYNLVQNNHHIWYQPLSWMIASPQQ